MNNKLGKSGEKIVADYLKNFLKYEIKGTNIKCATFGEIDIVAVKNNIYYFIEVKSRTSDRFMNITDTIDYRKKQALRNAAMYYITQNELHEYTWRIDLATYNKETEEIEIYENVLD